MDQSLSGRPNMAGPPEVRLTETALRAHNAQDEALRLYWEAQAKERVARLMKAAEELGFELPRRCY